MSTATIITDGAWGTELQARGLAAGECPDRWNLTHPEAVRAVAAAYAEAGSQIVLTNTFRANRIALAGYGFAQQVGAINRAGVELSRQGAAGRAKVFASIGPSGKMLVAGEVTEDELRAAYSEQAQALAGAGADALVIETMSDLNDAVIAVEAARATGLQVVASMVYDSGRNKDRTMMGTTPEQAAVRLAEAGADIIGANCGCGIEGYVAIAARLAAATDRPIWIKANAGLPEMIDGRVTYRMTAEKFASEARKMTGVTYIGGCCGTNPAFIRALISACG
jgi:5-methyltetrahydrofolate--homocysteine methyltransferase